MEPPSIRQRYLLVLTWTLASIRGIGAAKNPMTRFQTAYSVHPEYDRECPYNYKADENSIACCWAYSATLTSALGSDGKHSPICCWKSMTCTEALPVVDWTTDDYGVYIYFTSATTTTTTTTKPTKPDTTPTPGYDDDNSNSHDTIILTTTIPLTLGPSPNPPVNTSPAAAADDDPSSSSSGGGGGGDGGGGISGGAIIGIVVSCVCSILGLLFGIWFRFYKLRRRERREELERAQLRAEQAAAANLAWRRSAGYPSSMTTVSPPVPVPGSHVAPWEQPLLPLPRPPASGQRPGWMG